MNSVRFVARVATVFAVLVMASDASAQGTKKKSPIRTTKRSTATSRSSTAGTQRRSTSTAKKSTSSKTTSSKSSSSKSSSSSAKTASKGRLPNHYGKLKLKTEQRDEIYAIQARYKKQIEALEAQLAALKAKQDSDIERVLTTTQRRSLSQIRSQSKTSSKTRTSRSTSTRSSTSRLSPRTSTRKK